MATDERAAAAGDVVAQAHAKLLVDSSLQFRFPAFVPPQPPDWLPALAKALRAMGPALRVGFWVIVAALVLTLAYGLFRAALNYRWRGRGARIGGLSPEPEPPSLRPGARQAAALLEEADRLAGLGQFEAAARVLLFRTIADLESRRPRAVRPALTSRDIAALDEIPPPARGAFAAIAEQVELGFFGGRAVGAEAFDACRRSYLNFIDPANWAASARS
jgi:hypothetical protein